MLVKVKCGLDKKRMFDLDPECSSAKPRCQTLSYEALSYLVGQVIKDLAKKFVRFLHY